MSRRSFNFTTVFDVAKIDIQKGHDFDWGSTVTVTVTTESGMVSETTMHINSGTSFELTNDMDKDKDTEND
tara:strand:- start:187 stop:399 length:213 start_codon:yes stop_codon:yes gene_type:complete